MQKRTNACAAQFLRPQFLEVIDWKFDAHRTLLLQPENSCEQRGNRFRPPLIREAVHKGSLNPPQSTNGGNCEKRQQRERGAALCEHLAVTRVEGQVMLGWNFDITRQHAFSKRAAVFISQHAYDATKFINETRYTG